MQARVGSQIQSSTPLYFLDVVSFRIDRNSSEALPRFVTVFGVEVFLVADFFLDLGRDFQYFCDYKSVGTLLFIFTKEKY